MNDRRPEDAREYAPKGNGSRRPVQIMAEINRTRDEMDQTLNAIEHRLTPGQLVDQGLDYLKNSGAREYASNLGASLKTNPLPATLCGIGLAWLMAVGNKPPQPSSGTGGMQAAKDTVSSGMQSAKDGVQSAKDTLASGMQSARENWEQILEDNPLVLGAVGLAIGALAGSLAPRTSTEDELMGEARDDLVEQAKQTAAAAASAAVEKTAPKEKTEDSTKWPASAER